MRRALSCALVCLLAGCVSTRSNTPSKPAAPPDVDTLNAPVAALVGHVLSVNPQTLTAVVDISPFAKLPPSLAGRILLTRTDDLTLTGQVRASAYLRGRTLGVQLIAGRPRIGDEVVLAPTPPR